MELLGDEAQVKSFLVRLKIVLVLVQDSYTVCSKQGSEIILTAPDGTPRYEAQVESRLGLFRDSVSVGAR